MFFYKNAKGLCTSRKPRNFPKRTLPRKEIYRVDSISSQPRRVVCSLAGPSTEVSRPGHLLLSGLKSPGGTVSARGGEALCRAGSRSRALGVLDLLSGTSQAPRPPHKMRASGVRQQCCGLTSESCDGHHHLFASGCKAGHAPK